MKSGRWVPGSVFVFLLSFFLASSSIAAGPDWGAPGGAIPPARPGSLNAVPDPASRPPLTQTAPAVVGTVLTTKGFAFASSLGAPDTEVVQFPVPGPGKVILEASNTGTPLAKLGLIARAPKPPGQSPVDTRWDGPTPLRVEFPVTAQDLANLGTKGNVWTVFITLRDLPPPRGTGGRYAIPGLAAVGNLKVSFVAYAPAQKTALEPKAMPNLGTARPGSGVFPAGTPQEAPVKAAQPTQAATQPAGMMSPPAKIAGLPVSQRQEIKTPKEIPGTIAATPRNPSGFTATAGAGGDVILKWSPVKDAIYYSLQGSGVQSVSGMPPNVTGTTYSVKGLPPGTHSWVLFAVYSGPSGPYWGDESNPAKTSMTVAGPASGKYRVTINGLRVNSATWDTALQTDGKGDEIFLVVDLQELNATGNLAGAAQTRISSVYGDTNGFPSRIAAGSLSPKGGIRSGDRIPNVPEPWKRSGPPQQKQFPLFVWEGTLVDGQNGVLIVPAIWEQDSTAKQASVYNTTTEINGSTLKPIREGAATGVIDMKASSSPIVRLESNIISAAERVAGATAGAAERVAGATGAALKRIFSSLGAAAGIALGESKDRPIGMIEYGGGYVFDPQVITLTYRTAEATLAPNALQRGPGILELRYVDAPKLAGDYSMYVQIERVQ